MQPSDKIHDLERRIRQLEAALQLVLVPSLQLENTDESGPTASVTAGFVGGGKVPISLHQSYGHYSRPLTDAVHIVANVAGTNGRGISIASNDERSRPQNLAPGDVTMQDAGGQWVWLSGGQNLIVNVNTKVTITAPLVEFVAPLVKIDGDLVVTGDVTDRDNTNGSLNFLREQYDLHRHTGVQAGGATTNTTTNPV
jgi:phage gp45-like